MLLVFVAALGLAAARDTANDARNAESNRTSPRVFVNTSIPFSVAPQPVPDTAEVALAKERFMKTFELIRDAIVAADASHLNLAHLENEIRNHIDHFEDHGDDDAGVPEPVKTTTTTSTTTTTTTTTTTERHVHEETTPAPTTTIAAPTELEFEDDPAFPDPFLEPEYFLPSVHVDPLLLSQLDMKLPANPFVQEMRPVGTNANGGTCYEMILLEPEIRHFRVGNPNLPPGGLSFPSHSSLLESLARPIQGRTRSGALSASQQIFPVGTPAVPDNRTDVSRASKTSRAHTLRSEDVPDTASAVSSAFRAAHPNGHPAIPSHFKSPQLVFGGR